MRALLLALLLTALAPALEKFPLPWPAPEGFRSETLPFPLSFAPDIPYRGVEEIRFAPGFGKPDQPGYFTYTFIWFIRANEKLYLVRDLNRYFSGLMQAVGKQDPPPFPTTVEVELVHERLGFSEGPGIRARAKTWDAFYTKAPLELHLDIYRLQSPDPEYALYYFEVSPKSMEPLLPLRDKLRL